ncbi:MAG TPA: histidine phosphatase family protein [Planctomycetaceae bacterium]|nr:histidine phosphatase family protein [Planctomycetaceae bacterium]
MTNSHDQLPQIFLARHGETTWSATRQHTGLTDLPLTERGERNARHLSEQLRGIKVSHVLTSPLKRASRTCELAGFGTVAKVDNDLVEWDYGEYEGKKTSEIDRLKPGWELFRDGCPGGESVAEVAVRVDRVVTRLREISSNALLFSHGHFLSVFAARWLGLDAAAGRLFFLDTAALSILGYHHGRNDPVIRLWNRCS